MDMIGTGAKQIKITRCSLHAMNNDMVISLIV